MEADEDGDGKLSFDEFARTVANTVCYYVLLFFFCVLGLGKAQLPCPCQDMLACIVSSAYFPTTCLSPTFTYTYSISLGYCKANDAWRLILDVTNARWPLPYFNRPNHSADPLLVALTITRLTFCYLLLLNINHHLASLFHLQLTHMEIYILRSFAHSRSRWNG